MVVWKSKYISISYDSEINVCWKIDFIYKGGGRRGTQGLSGASPALDLGSPTKLIIFSFFLFS
jgi:hypothetical protein